jgi:hypothetical protein
MSDLLVLIAMIIASVGAAALVLLLSKVVIIKLPEILMQAVKGNSTPSVPARQQSTGQNKAGSCPFC